MRVQRAAAGSPEFFAETAVGGDGPDRPRPRSRPAPPGQPERLGRRRPARPDRRRGWTGVQPGPARRGGAWPPDGLSRAAETLARPSASLLRRVDAAVAAPILDEPGDRVIGIVYGTLRCSARRWPAAPRSGRSRSPQVMQVLAAAAAAGMARQRSKTEAARRLAQFEQFASAELARALDADPELLRRERGARSPSSAPTSAASHGWPSASDRAWRFASPATSSISSPNGSPTRGA